jgi:hypothetical protein
VRLIDSNHNDRSRPTKFTSSNGSGEGEHGNHALALGPDKMIYVMNGNHTRSRTLIGSPHKNYQEDFLLAPPMGRQRPRGGILAQAEMARTDPEGKKWELMLGGFGTHTISISVGGRNVHSAIAIWNGTGACPEMPPHPHQSLCDRGESGWRSGRRSGGLLLGPSARREHRPGSPV